MQISPKQAELIAVSVKLGELSLSLRSLRREDVAAGEVKEDAERPALRGTTFTRDRDVSRLIARMGNGGPGQVVHVVRGDKAEEVKIGGSGK